MKEIIPNAIYCRQDIMDALDIKESSFASEIKKIKHRRSGGRVYCTGRQLLAYIEGDEIQSCAQNSKAMKKVDNMVALRS